MTDAAERLDHAVQVLGVLFPGGSVQRDARGTTDPRRTFTVAPLARHPRILLPQAPRGAGRAALRAYGGRLSAKARIAYRGAAAVASLPGSAGARHSMTVADAGAGLDDALGTVLGREVSLAVHLTPARANRKPIVQALAAGEPAPIAFAKVATTPLARRLAADEHAALSHLASHPVAGIRPPEVAGDCPWQDATVLALRPLPTWARGRLPTRDEVVTAHLALAHSLEGGRRRLGDAEFFHDLADTAQAVAGPAAADLKAAVESVEQRFGDVEVELGGSHGDWSPWNMWHTGGELLVWDWERFGRDVPIGTDLVHYTLQELLVMRSTAPLDAARAVVDDAPSLLGRVTDDPASARAIAALHLLSLAIRYESDGQTAAGSALGDTRTWLLPAVHHAVATGRSQ